MAWRSATVKYGDTLQRLALRELGSAERWPDIALLNGLIPPYYAELADNGVAAYGDTLLLPIYQADALAAADDVFLTDLQLDENGFLHSDGEDLLTVSGVANLRQALAVRVVVPKRSLLFHPDYGCWAFTLIGSVNRNALAQLAGFYIQAALLEDPRVQSVANLTPTLINDSITVQAQIVPVSGEAVAFQRAGVLGN